MSNTSEEELRNRLWEILDSNSLIVTEALAKNGIDDLMSFIKAYGKAEADKAKLWQIYNIQYRTLENSKTIPFAEATIKAIGDAIVELESGESKDDTR